MRLLTLALIALGGWISIIIIHAICISIAQRKNQSNDLSFLMQSKEIVADGNNLFSTAVFYYITYLIAYFTHFVWLHWILFGITAACCIPPLISLFLLLPQTIYWKDTYMNLAYIAHIINTFIPIIMSLFILFDFCISY